MKFGRYLKENIHPPWREHYIDYARLKKQVERTARVQQSDSALVDTSFRDSVINLGVGEFMDILDAEIDKVTRFYRRKAAELRTSLSRLSETIRSLKTTSVEALEDVGRDAVLLVQFLELNLTGLRKILKKHEKRVKGHPFAEDFLKSRRSKESALAELCNHEELEEIYSGVRSALRQLNREHAAFVSDAGEAGPTVEGGHALLHSGSSVASSALSMEPAAAGVASDGPRGRGRGDRLLHRQLSTIYVHEPLLRAMRDRLRALDDASRFVESFVNTLADESGIIPAEGQGMSKSGSKLSLYLNLLSTFLFMVNYYVVLPTSGAYCKALGADESFSGVTMGILPLAACLAAAAYSYATQYTYRVPLIVAGLLCMGGNMLYAAAQPLDSLAVVILGRVVVGMGGARVVNRRYIADHVDLSYRTEASAAFVGFTALGMAVGPGLAALISLIPPFSFAGMPFNSMTNPGYVMCAAWLPFTVTVALCFRDPPRPTQFTKEVKTRPNMSRTSSAWELLRQGTVSKFDDNLDPLVDTVQDGESVPPSRHLAVAVLLWVYLVDKLAAEAWLTSVPLTTAALFGWTERDVGLFICLVCVAVLPAANLSRVVFATVAMESRERRIMW